MIRRAQQFFQWEGASGVLLMGAALLALFAANSPLSSLYDQLLTLKLGLHFGDSAIIKPLVLWINDGLMAVFFLLVALEIKREVLEGELSSLDRVALPTIAAVGGMAAPALVYLLVTWGDPVAMNGWAIPAATDIAFALGVLALLGKRVPTSLKLFLLTLAVVDDLGAVVIIAVFYTSKLAPISLLIALAALAVLIAMNRMRVRSTAAYILVGMVAWFAVLNSGVHATLAGVAVGLIIPHSRDGETSMLARLEHNLQPWVAFFIVPVFAFANAGVALTGLAAGRPDLTGAVGDRPGPVSGQTGRRVRLRLGGHQAGLGAAAPGRELAPALRRGAAYGHRFHHESVHRLAGLRGTAGGAGGRGLPPGHPGGFGGFGGRRLPGAAGVVFPPPGGRPRCRPVSGSRPPAVRTSGRRLRRQP